MGLFWQRLRFARRDAAAGAGRMSDEGKLLLFIKEEVASRASRKGRWLEQERVRKRRAPAAKEWSHKHQKGATGAAVALCQL